MQPSQVNLMSSWRGRVGGLAIVALIFVFPDPGAALCLGIFLAAWIGKRWLDYRDTLVEEQDRSGISANWTACDIRCEARV